MSSDLPAIPAEFLDDFDPDFVIPDGGEHPPRVLVSHGKEEGVLSPAWEVYGELHKGDILIQYNDADFVMCHPTDYWFMLSAQVRFFAGNRDAWTKQLEEASLDLNDCKRGGDMALQALAAMIWLPSEKRPEDLVLPDECKDGLAVFFGHEKARASGIQRFSRALARQAKQGSDPESDGPVTFQIHAHLFGQVKETRPVAHGKNKGQVFSYSCISCKTRRTSPELMKRLGAFLRDFNSMDTLHLVVSRLEEEWKTAISLATNEDDGGVFDA